MRVTIPPGVDGIPTSSIPTDPQQFVTWFTSVYLKRWAANGDARNAVPTSASVQITGDIGSPAGIGIGPNSITNGELVMRSPLSVMGNATDAEADVQDITAGADGDSLQRIAGALVFAPVTPMISVADSIDGDGTPSSPLQLVNDDASPGNSEYYGTNALGTKGYFPVTGGTSNVTVLTQGGGASQGYNVPSNSTFVQVILKAGGGGGGSGIKASAAGSGGGGGGGGGTSSALFLAADLGSTVTVTFSNAATGGAGGTAQTVGSTGGNNGTAGSNVSFGNLLIAYGGNGGGLGGNSAGAAATGGQGKDLVGGTSGAGIGSAAGAVGVAQSGTAGISSNYSNTGGGGGGGLSTVPTAFAGGAGGSSPGNGFMLLASAPGGTAGGNVGTNGANGSGQEAAGGGGGGGAGIGTTNGGQGGNGGNYGGGGGGGGACQNAATHSGAGGAGGPAACIIIAW